MGRLPAVTYACFVGLVAGLSPSEAIAQDMPFATGRVIEDVVADDDSTQTFTLYIPTAYSPDRTWPLVVLIDPRGNSV